MNFECVRKLWASHFLEDTVSVQGVTQEVQLYRNFQGPGGTQWVLLQVGSYSRDPDKAQVLLCQEVIIDKKRECNASICPRHQTKE